MRLIFFLLLAAISIPVLAFLAVFSGAESAPLCGDRPVVVSGAGAAAFQAGITRMGADVARGRAATATFDESQVSSSASTLIRNTPSVDVSGLRVCFWGDARQVEAIGAVLLSPIPWRVRLSIAGAPDLTGTHPRLAIRRVQVGNLPERVSNLLVTPLTGVVDRALAQVAIPFPPLVSISDGAATLSVGPR